MPDRIETTEGTSLDEQDLVMRSSVVSKQLPGPDTSHFGRQAVAAPFAPRLATGLPPLPGGYRSARSSTRMRVRPSLTATRRSQPTART